MTSLLSPILFMGLFMGLSMVAFAVLAGGVEATAVETPTAAKPAALSTGDRSARVTDLIEQLRRKETRKNAREALVDLDDAATPALLKHTRDANFSLRWEMANILGLRRDPSSIPALVENALRDSNSHVRWRSLWALGQFDDSSKAVDLLREAFRSEAPGDETLRWNAAVAMSMFGVADVVPMIHAGVRRADPWQRWEAINALGRVHNEASSPVLASVLASGDLRERQEAVLTLGKIGGAKATDLLMTALTDAAPGVRWRSCMSLGMSGDQRAIAELKRLQTVEQDAMVLQHAKAAIEKLTPKETE